MKIAFLAKFNFSTSIIFNQLPNISKLTLNKPKQLNSFDEEILTELKKKITLLKDSNQKLVILNGAGKGFCGGGNIKLFYQLLDMPKEKGLDLALDQLRMQYQSLNELNLIKPPLMSIWNGIVMGGGVGMSVYNPIKVATEKAQFAMPEVNLGLFADNSATYFFSKIPRNFGKYMGTTGTIIKGKDLVKLGIADYYMPSDRITQLEQTLENKITPTTTIQQIKTLIENHIEFKYKDNYEIPEEWKYIEEYFNYTNFNDCYKNLTTNITPQKQKVLDKCVDASPLSMQVCFRMVVEGGKLKSQEEAFDRDCRMFQVMTKKNDDFKEGIQQVLTKRKYKPRFQYKTMQDVPSDAVDEIFSLLPNQKPLYPL